MRFVLDGTGGVGEAGHDILGSGDILVFVCPDVKLGLIFGGRGGTVEVVLDVPAAGGEEGRVSG